MYVKNSFLQNLTPKVVKRFKWVEIENVIKYNLFC